MPTSGGWFHFISVWHGRSLQALSQIIVSHHSTSGPADASGPEASAGPEVELCLYVAGNSPRSNNARHNLDAICRQNLAGRHTLTVVDLQQQPDKAGEDEILGVPCLIKKRPGLVRRLVGDLSDRDRVLKVLGLG